jgi:hypothetical protein
MRKKTIEFTCLYLYQKKKKGTDMHRKKKPTSFDRNISFVINYIVVVY